MGNSWEREACMNIQMLETSVRNREMYDISEIITPPTWSTSLESQPGTLEFNMIEDPKVFLRAGDTIEMKIDGKKIFEGKVFRRSKLKDKLWKITAYDNMRYLQNEDTLLFPANPVSSRFKKICQAQGLPHKVRDTSYYNCSPVIKDKHSYYSMIEEAIEETRKGSGARFGVWSNGSTLELFLLNRMITKIVIGDQSLLTDYEYEASIDDMYNSVKVMREDEEKSKREIYVASNNRSIEKYGKLQMVETVSDADLNSSQLQKMANDLLKTNQNEMKTIRLNAIGNLGIRAGNSFILRVTDLHRDEFAKDSLALVTKCTHTFGSAHVMSLEVEVVA